MPRKVPNIDAFASTLLEEAKRFLELAKEADEPAGRDANLHASLMLSFCALEAHVNAVADEMAMTKNLLSHDRGVLLEREVRLEDGQFKLKKELKIFRLEDRILFLHARFSKALLDKKVHWWASLKAALGIRNQLTHPKEATTITVDSVEASIQSIIDAIDALYQAIYGKGFPALSRGLQSKLTF